MNGAQEFEVDEPRELIKGNLLRSDAILQVEFEAYPEPKALSPEDLENLRSQCGGPTAVSRHIGVSESFVRQLNKFKAIKLHWTFL